MITVELMGGMGNQMFQYAFGVSVAKARDETVAFRFCKGQRRPYSLGAFNCRVDPAEHTGQVYGEPVFAFDPSVYTAPRGSAFVGHWQTERYFDESLVRQDLTLRHPVSAKTREIAAAIQRAGEKSAFLHIRRTDYMRPENIVYHGHPTLEYYDRAIKLIRAQHGEVKFFIFSDDIDWCKMNFGIGCTFVEHNTGREHEDIYLMSLCRNAVIANSSFSWWGAWLGDTQSNRMVFAPKTWFATNLESRDIVPERWTKLDN
jgi:hypothetical protein